MSGIEIDDGIVTFSDLHGMSLGEIIGALWSDRERRYRKLSEDQPANYFGMGAVLGVEILLRGIIIASMIAAGRKEAHRNEILDLLTASGLGDHADRDPVAILRALSMALLRAGIRPALPAALDGVAAGSPQPEIRDKLGNVVWRGEGDPPPNRKLN